jgi:hypothetical protein
MNYEHLQKYYGNETSSHDDTLLKFFNSKNSLLIFKPGHDYLLLLANFLSLYAFGPQKIFILYDGSEIFEKIFLKVYNSRRVQNESGPGCPENGSSSGPEVCFITNECQGQKRKINFEKFSIIFVTARILVVDLLKGDLNLDFDVDAPIKKELEQPPKKKSKKFLPTDPIINFKQLSGLVILRVGDVQLTKCGSKFYVYID